MTQETLIDLSHFDKCDWRKKKVLVTGGAGFIGSWLAEALVQLGADVTIFDNLYAGKLDNLNHVLKSIRFIKGDVRDKRELQQVAKDKNYIFHLAANASVPDSTNDPDLDFDINARGTYNLLKAIHEFGNKTRVIYASTAAVYGEPFYTPIDETHPLHPISPYGASKLSGEAYCFAFHKAYDLKTVSLRLFNIYGPRQPRYVVYDFLEKLSKNHTTLKVLGTGQQVRDFTYVTDAVNAFLLAALNDQVIGQAVNVGSGEVVSIKELALLILKLLGLGGNILLEFTGASWKGDVQTFLADISKAKKVLSYKPKVSLIEGLRLEIKWFERKCN